MGFKALIIIFFAFALSLLILSPAINVLPEWIRYNTQLYDLTIIIWLVSFALAFVKFGLEK